MAGRVERVEYRPGRFFVAARSRASSENEQNVIYLETARGKDCIQADRRVGGAPGGLLEIGRRPGGHGRADRADSVWFTDGCVAAGRRGDFGAAGRACGGGREYPGTVAMSEDQQNPVSRIAEPRNHRLRRGIYLLPSALTVGNLLCGFYAILATVKGGVADLDNAAKAIGLAILFDAFDGFGSAGDRNEHRFRQAVRFAGGHGQFRHRAGDSGIYVGRANHAGERRAGSTPRLLSWAGWSAWRLPSAGPGGWRGSTCRAWLPAGCVTLLACRFRLRQEWWRQRCMR